MPPSYVTVVVLGKGRRISDIIGGPPPRLAQDATQIERVVGGGDEINKMMIASIRTIWDQKAEKAATAAAAALFP